MRKKLTLTIDSEVYEMLQELPRRISVSDVASWMLRMFVKEFKRGHELTDDELKAYLNSTSDCDSNRS